MNAYSHRDGKICLATGAVSCIGEETAATLAPLGEVGVLVGCVSVKAESTLRKIRVVQPNSRVQARQLENSSVTVNALHPGVVATGIWRIGFAPINRLAQ